MKNHKKISEKQIVIKDEVSGYDKKILVKTFRLPNGIIENSFIEIGRDSVCIFPITSDGRIITVKQFRPAFEKKCIELPGGSIEKNEKIEDAALRELKEETGFVGEVEFLNCVPYSPYSTGKRYNFVAKNCHRIDNLDLDKNEFLQVVIWPLEKFKELLLAGEVRAADTAYCGLYKLNMLYF